jgi:hypothetical protein
MRAMKTAGAPTKAKRTMAVGTSGGRCSPRPSDAQRSAMIRAKQKTAWPTLGKDSFSR